MKPGKRLAQRAHKMHSLQDILPNAFSQLLNNKTENGGVRLIAVVDLRAGPRTAGLYLYKPCYGGFNICIKVLTAAQNNQEDVVL